jgi:polyhydroxyalkanoate synthesis regulator phasin
MAKNNVTDFMDTMVEGQKNLVNSAMENTKKLTNGNALLNDTIEKGSEWYNNWMENQKKFFSQTTEKATETADTAKTNANQMADFFQNWYNMQMSWGKNLWETAQGWMKDTAAKATGNPMEQATAAYNNWMNQWGSMFNTNNAGNWMNMQQWTNMNPFNMDAWKNTTTDANGLFNQWYQMLNNGFSEWQGHLENGTTQDAFRNMLNSTESFTRFYQMWAPMWKSIQEKTFNTDLYKNMINPAAYQEFMDKFFGFMPEGARQYMQQMTTLMQNGAKQAATTGFSGYNQMKQMFATMPGMSEGFNNMLNMYESMQSMFQNAVSPIAKMVTPNQYTKNIAEWQDIADRTVVYNIKNAQLQYMMYAQGTKVMDTLAESVMHKIEQGEEIKSMMALYQEWLNLSDKTFVALFESDEYSQLMAEVSALQLKLRKDIEAQMEKAMAGIPVATRSELDELYKTIYELKKEVRQLSRMLEIDGEVAGQAATAVAEQPATKAAAKTTSARTKKA